MAGLKKELGEAIACQLVQGDRGVFDVRVRSALLFSKHETGRFPRLEEVLAALAPIVERHAR